MNTTRLIITIVGSLIGIIVFIKEYFRSIRDYNLDKWNAIIAEVDFELLEDFSEYAQQKVIYREHFSKVQNLVLQIRRDAPAVKFKGRSGKKIQKKLEEVRNHFDEFLDETSSYRWEAKGSEDILSMLDKQNIYRRSSDISEGDQIAREAIKNAYEPIDEILKEFKEIDAIVNRLPFEMFYKNR